MTETGQELPKWAQEETATDAKVQAAGAFRMERFRNGHRHLLPPGEVPGAKAERGAQPGKRHLLKPLAKAAGGSGAGGKRRVSEGALWETAREMRRKQRPALGAHLLPRAPSAGLPK